MKAANQHMAFGVTSLVLVLIISPVIIFLVINCKKKTSWNFYILKSFCFFIIIIFITSYFQVRSATATIQIFSLSLTKKALELKNERGKADLLLFETLPRHIAIEYTQVDDYDYVIRLKID